MNAQRISLVAVMITGLVAGAGCAGRGAASRVELEELRVRLHDLERSNARTRSAYEEMEERVYLLQDRMEAARIALARRAPDAPTRQSVTLGPGAPAATPTSAPPAVRSYPTQAAPPLPGLPVQRVEPASATPSYPATETSYGDGSSEGGGESDEVVITMDEFHSRFDTPAEQRVASSYRAPASNGARQPGHPHVDTRGYTLPTGSATSATPVRATSNQPAAAASAQEGLAIYRRALDEFNRGEYERSIESLNAFIASGPQDDYMDNALFWLGECYYGLGRYQDALTNFQRVVSAYPDGNKVPDSLLKVALTYERLANDSSAREVLRVLVDTYPSTDAARRAEERLRALQ